MKNVLDEVITERRRQDAKWGGPEHDDTHVLNDWLRFIHDRARRVRDGHADYREEMIKIAALAVAAVESFDRISRPAEDPLEEEPRVTPKHIEALKIGAESLIPRHDGSYRLAQEVIGWLSTPTDSGRQE